MPNWPESERTHYMMYEDRTHYMMYESTSEGTPYLLQKKWERYFQTGQWGFERGEPGVIMLYPWYEGFPKLMNPFYQAEASKK